MTPIWNGGKISSMFAYEGSKYNDNLQFSSNEAKEAFYDGKWYLKVDGSCCAIDTISGIAYQRVNLPNKDIPKMNIKMENGSQPNRIVKDNKETHNYYWQPFDKPNENQKSKQRKLLEEIYKVTSRYCNEYKNNNSEGNLILVEFCGQKFQKTPNIKEDIVIVEHLKQEFNTILSDGTNIREPELVKKYLSEHAIEGFICSHPVTNTRYKIRSNMFFDKKSCLYEQLHQYWMKFKSIDKFSNFLDERDYPLIYN